MAWIQTFTGKLFYPLEPRSEDICIEDIAHALSLICRFNGHCLSFYSVCQHSLFVADVVKELSYDEKYQLYALMHDASEAYICDIPRPVKPLLDNYKKIEAKIELAIRAHFGIEESLEMNAVMKKADWIALATEARDLMSKTSEPWELMEQPSERKIVPIDSKTVEQQFLQRHHVLVKALT